MGECRGPRPPLFFPRTVDFPAVGTEADASAVFAGDAPDFAVAVQYGLVDTVFNESAFLVDSCDSAQCLQRLARSLERAVFNCSAINPDDSSGFLFVPGSITSACTFRPSITAPASRKRNTPAGIRLPLPRFRRSCARFPGMSRRKWKLGKKRRR